MKKADSQSDVSAHENADLVEFFKVLIEIDREQRLLPQEPNENDN